MATGHNIPLKILKIFGITAAALLGLVLLVLVALQVCLHTSVLDKIVYKVASGYVDGNLEIGDVNLRLFKTFPNACISIDDLLVTYTHDRYDSLAVQDDEGRGEDADTLVSLGHLYARADYMQLLKGHRLVIHDLDLDEIRAFAYRYDTLTANWDVIRIPESTDTTSGSFRIDSYSIDKLSISTPRVVFQDLPSLFAVTADFDSLFASGAFVPGQDSSMVKADLAIRGLSAGDLISTLGTTYVRELAALKTDALVSVDVTADGYVYPDLLSDLPTAKVCIDIPDSKVSYSRYFQNADLRFHADGENTEEDKMNVDVPDLMVRLDGLDLDARGGVTDVLGRDRRYDAEASAKAVLDKIVRYLPASLRNISASGNIDLSLKGSILQSQLDASAYAEADLSGHLSGDALKVDDPADNISCYIGNPSFNIGTVDSVVDADDRSLALSGQIDSLDFNLGETLSAQGRSISLLGQNASKLISPDSRWHPFAGKIQADRLSVRYEDSLRVVLDDSQNRFTVLGQQSGESQLPYLRFETDNGRLLFKNGPLRAFAREASFVASARMRQKRAPDASRSMPDSIRRRFFSRALLDSAKMPDFLSEKDFRLSDIDIKVNNGISNLLKTWTPSGKISISDGMVVTPAFPLRNRFSGLGGTFKDDVLKIDSMRVTAGTSDIYATLEAQGLKRAMTMGRSLIKIDADINSERLNINEILAALKAGTMVDTLAMADEDEISEDEYVAMVALDTLAEETALPSYSLIVVPSNVNANINLSSGRVDYADLRFDDFHTSISMKERCLQLVDTRASSELGRFALDAFYSTKTKNDINTGFNLQLSDVTADKVISLFPKIDEVVPMLKSFKGNLDCEMAATTQLDTNMNFMLPTINGMFKIGGRNLVLEDLGSLKKITKILMFKDKATGWIDDMTVNGVISDNTLEVFPFLLSVDRYTVALNGIQSLSSGFDYHISIIKSPLPFKIGVNIYGDDFSHWSYRLGKAKYRSTKIPLFNDAVDDMQVNLVSSIRNIFSRGVDKALKESRDAQSVINRRKRELAYQGPEGDDILSREEQYQLEEYMVKQEVDDEEALLNEEIDRLFAEMSIF